MQVFVMLKPDALKRNLCGHVISAYESRGWGITNSTFTVPTKELAEQHYTEHTDKGFYEKLINFTCSGPVLAMVLTKKSGTIAEARSIMADVRSVCAIPGGPENVVHCSDSEEGAMDEIELWFGSN